MINPCRDVVRLSVLGTKGVMVEEKGRSEKLRRSQEACLVNLECENPRVFTSEKPYRRKVGGISGLERLKPSSRKVSLWSQGEGDASIDSMA